MKQSFTLLFFLLLFSITSFSQLTHSFTDREKTFKEVSELFKNQQFAVAFPLLQELKSQYSQNPSDYPGYWVDDLDFFYIIAGLKLGLTSAEDQSIQYLNWISNSPRKEQMYYHLGQYYFIKNDFRKSLENYKSVGLDNLNNEQIANAKFEMAYCYFNLKMLKEAKPLFNEIQQLNESKYYLSANYYYGFISYYDHLYDQALKSFKIVEKAEEYKNIVPYYIAEIYYFQQKKDASLRYSESIINKNELYYANELNQLMGQIHYEKGSYVKALPLLENYIKKSTKVSKEIIYELSFCYYKNNQLDKAIEGFRQLSSVNDSLGQNSMYLLGDCYLRTNQKTNAKNAFQFCANNSSNKLQQEISLFNYAKLSYELGFQDIALKEMKSYIIKLILTVI